MANHSQSLQEFLNTPEIPDLGPGPRGGCIDLASLDARLEPILSSAQTSQPSRDLIRATIYLWHDHLDASHTISQSVGNKDGSYLHGLMHRREPDYWNSKYWFRRVGQHPCFSRLAAEAEKLLVAKASAGLASALLPGNQWDPSSFVDQCEQVAGLPRTDPRVQALREIQALEFRILLEHLGC